MWLADGHLKGVEYRRNKIISGLQPDYGGMSSAGAMPLPLIFQQ